jgi:hypothetical protein
MADKTCKNCGSAIFRRRSGYCPDCYRLFCNHCGVRLPEGRVQARCYDCDKAQRQKWSARMVKHCSQCGEELPADAVARWCYSCRKVYRDFQLATLRRLPDRRCFKCGGALKQGQWSNYCTECQRRRRWELSVPYHRRKAGRPPRRCADCGGWIEADNRQRYCRPCKRDYNAMWWEARGRERQRERRAEQKARQAAQEAQERACGFFLDRRDGGGAGERD